MVKLLLHCCYIVGGDGGGDVAVLIVGVAALNPEQDKRPGASDHARVSTAPRRDRRERASEAILAGVPQAQDRLVDERVRYLVNGRFEVAWVVVKVLGNRKVRRRPD